jgi:hypothetical protein
MKQSPGSPLPLGYGRFLKHLKSKKMLSGLPASTWAPSCFSLYFSSLTLKNSLYTLLFCLGFFLVGYKEFGRLLITDCTRAVSKHLVDFRHEYRFFLLDSLHINKTRPKKGITILKALIIQIVDISKWQ